VGTDGKKNIDWIDTDNQLTVKNINKIDGLTKKKILDQWFNFIREKFILGPMIDTIGQKKIF
jgi:hypothetical protein